MPRYRAAVLTLSLVLTPMSLAAQSNIQFAVSGFGCVYLPSADLFNEQSTEAVLSFGHATGFAAGGRIAIWPTDRIGIEAEGAYLGSDMELAGVILDFGTIDTTFNANVFVGSVNVMYAFIKPPLEPLAIFVSGGVGFVSRGGDFFDEDLITDLENSDIAGVVGLGIRYGVARSVNIRADIRDYISSYEDAALLGDSQLQNDLLITGSVELVFGGR